MGEIDFGLLGVDVGVEEEVCRFEVCVFGWLVDFLYDEYVWVNFCDDFCCGDELFVVFLFGSVE